MKKLNKKKTIIICVSFVALLIVIIGLYLLFSGREISKEQKETPYIQDNTNEVSNVKDEREVPPQSYTASVPIFMYHFILDDYGNYPDVENFLKPETLEEQIKYIVDNGYQPIFINEIDKVYKYEKPVALTFDDCFVYFYNNAFPIIKKYNVKVTCNLIYNYMNGENYLTNAQVKEMIDSGLVSIESHTLSHQQLTTLSSEQEQKELIESKECFENDFGIELSTICYPIGDYDQNTINVAKDHYKFGLAMTGGVYHSNIHTNMYAIPRIYANRSMPLSTYANYLKQSKVEVFW